MPTQGSNIPVLTVEKFWLDKDGRAIWAHSDGVAAASGAWNSVSSQSASGWLKASIISGTAGTTVLAGYIPIYSQRTL